MAILIVVKMKIVPVKMAILACTVEFTYSGVQLSVGPCSFLHFLVWFKFHIASNCYNFFLNISGSLDKCLLTRFSQAWVCGWSVFCCEECCLLWVSHRASVAAVTDAGLPSIYWEQRHTAHSRRTRYISMTLIPHSLWRYVCAYVHAAGRVCHPYKTSLYQGDMAVFI